MPGLGKQIISKATHVAGAEAQSPYISKLVINTLFRYYSSMLVQFDGNGETLGDLSGSCFATARKLVSWEKYCGVNKLGYWLVSTKHVMQLWQIISHHWESLQNKSVLLMSGKLFPMWSMNLRVALILLLREEKPGNHYNVYCVLKKEKTMEI